jgi:hypothetical protein
VWVWLPSPLISVPPGRSLALRVPFAGLAYHRLSRCWLARRPSDLVDLHSYSSTPEVIFPIGCPAQLISIPMSRPQGFDSRFGFVRDRVGYRAGCSWPADYAVPIPVFVRPSLVVVVLFGSSCIARVPGHFVWASTPGSSVPSHGVRYRMSGLPASDSMCWYDPTVMGRASWCLRSQFLGVPPSGFRG